MIPEGEEPAPPVRGRRDQVMAAKFEVPANWTPPHYEKDASSEQFLKDVMATNKLMKSLAPSDREQLMRAFQKARRRAAAAAPIFSRSSFSGTFRSPAAPTRRRACTPPRNAARPTPAARSAPPSHARLRPPSPR